MHGPIPQDPRYHDFADQRTILGVPNFWNVASNAPFILVGLAGLAALGSRASHGFIRDLRSSYVAFFVATALIGFGSAYYHLTPNNSTLLWDRLPMTFAFMAFLSIVFGENINPALGRRLLLPLLLLGLASLLYWYFTEQHGHGDLRPYVLVQYLPMLLVPLIMVLFPSPLSRPSFIWSLLGVYALAKALELLDSALYTAVGVSGHTLKHLVASGGLFLFVAAVRLRVPTHPTQ